jgi:hypothetical protein
MNGERDTGNLIRDVMRKKLDRITVSLRRKAIDEIGFLAAFL